MRDNSATLSRDNNGILLLVVAVVVFYIFRKGRGQTIIIPTSSGPVSISHLSWPVSGRVSSEYGNRVNPVTGAYTLHNGIDIAVPVNTTVLAPADGIVQSQYSNSAGGVQMLVKHDNGFKTGYAHLNSYLVSTGSRIKSGQAIAKTGNTGNTTGPHLHFTVRDASGKLQNPRNYLS